jgi:hypothetical protein
MLGIEGTLTPVLNGVPLRERSRIRADDDGGGASCRVKALKRPPPAKIEHPHFWALF